MTRVPLLLALQDIEPPDSEGRPRHSISISQTSEHGVLRITAFVLEFISRSSNVVLSSEPKRSSDACL